MPFISALFPFPFELYSILGRSNGTKTRKGQESLSTSPTPLHTWYNPPASQASAMKGRTLTNEKSALANGAPPCLATHTDSLVSLMSLVGHFNMTWHQAKTLAMCGCGQEAEKVTWSCPATPTVKILEVNVP